MRERMEVWSSRYCCIINDETTRQSLVKTFSKKLPPKSGGGQAQKNTPLCSVPNCAKFVTVVAGSDSKWRNSLTLDRDDWYTTYHDKTYSFHYARAPAFDRP